jgi:hypothetical protein
MSICIAHKLSKHPYYSLTSVIALVAVSGTISTWFYIQGLILEGWEPAIYYGYSLAINYPKIHAIYAFYPPVHSHSPDLLL